MVFVPDRQSCKARTSIRGGGPQVLLANKYEDIVNLQGAEAYCVTTRTVCLLYDMADELLLIEALRKHELIYHPQQYIKCVWSSGMMLPKTLSFKTQFPYYLMVWYDIVEFNDPLDTV